LTAGPVHMDRRFGSGVYTLRMAERPTLSVVIPLYNEQQTLPGLDRRLRGFLESLNETWEVVFVDDGSNDQSLAMLRDMAARERRYKVLSFSRNFGHQIAITAGVDWAAGKAVIVMDADLQDPPEAVGDMIQRWREGYDVVYGVRSRRLGETIFKRLTAAVFYRLLRAMLGFDVPVDTGDFRLMSRQVVLTLRLLRERHRFVRGMVSWIGFKQTAVYYERQKRIAGETKYGLRKMIRFAIDGITSFSIVPLRLATWLGVLAGIVAMATGAWALYQKFYAQGVVQGWTTIMLLVALGSSAQLLMTGILGEYVGRIYEEVKRRPLYTVAERLNVREADQEEQSDSFELPPSPPASPPSRTESS
jgi:glycosyltransferase involved in cell wall biosynthesis